MQKNNSQWQFVKDRPQEEEAEAVLIIHKDEDYNAQYGAYIISRSLADMIGQVIDFSEPGM
ncbi:hypothetical protein IQ273_32085 [Nodosilinea sp. LEGE 07298]|uniref:hypothetical protein n=1 Tax=Nodosilinea sp. LEGE 07298 TaxID=2777970 RepID=UPI00187FE89B|nr:hypothetical protein [Nodosilinea sp. LEGE 07298]MBE9114010.1 hypothetical protein [Nodosilinea sp. LEGE 07298]